MKELSIEEKASRYDETFRRAKEKYAMFEGMKQGDVLEDVFPELKDSDDEKIRKALIQNLKERFGTKGTMGGILDMPKVLVWLEKQEEPQVYETEDGKVITYSETNGYRVEQKPAEWSEEDDYNAERLLCLLTNEQDNYPQLSCDFQDIEGIKDLVKSLKDRYTWKPNDSQMTALNYVVNIMASSEKPIENDYYYNVFKDLREQLKKLMEE